MAHASSSSRAEEPRPLSVLVYSDDVTVRESVMMALGRRPVAELPRLEYVEVATEPTVIRRMDAGGIDLVILDGEATPAGGMGICRQLKDEIYRCPPVLVLIGRSQDAWLATWSRADAVVPHPDRPGRPRRGRRGAAAVAGRRLPGVMTADRIADLAGGADHAARRRRPRLRPTPTGRWSRP